MEAYICLVETVICLVETNMRDQALLSSMHRPWHVCMQLLVKYLRQTMSRSREERITPTFLRIWLVKKAISADVEF